MTQQLDQEDLEPLLRGYIAQVIHMSVGTCANSKPWVCEVHFAYDDDLNLYFCSLPSTRHCQEIAVNPQVAGNIVVQHAPGEAPRGVYFEGRAERLNDVDERHPAFLAYEGRFNRGAVFFERTKDPNDLKFYCVTPSSFYIFDARESKPSQKYHLPWKN